TLQSLGATGVLGSVRAWQNASDSGRHVLVGVLASEVGLTMSKAEETLIEGFAAEDPELVEFVAEAFSGGLYGPRALRSNGELLRAVFDALAAAAVDQKRPEVRQRLAWQLGALARQHPTAPAVVAALGRMAQSKHSELARQAAESYADSGVMQRVNQDPKLQA